MAEAELDSLREGMTVQENLLRHERDELDQTLQATKAELEKALEYRETLIAVQQAYNELNHLHSGQHELLIATQREFETLDASSTRTEQELLIARTEVSNLLSSQAQYHQQLEELQRNNNVLQQHIDRVTAILEGRNAEISDLNKELDQITLEREKLAQESQNKHADLLQVQQELSELQHSKLKLEEMTAITSKQKDVELEDVKQEIHLLLSEKQALLHGARKEEKIRQEQAAELHHTLGEKERQLSELQKVIKALQTREVQASTDSAAKERDLQSKLTESGAAFSETMNESALRLEQKDALVR